MLWHSTARPCLVPRGELNGELRALLKGLARPGWFSGDVAQQYLNASSLGWAAAKWLPGSPLPDALCEPGPHVELSTLSAFTWRMTSSSAAVGRKRQ
jgi:hypothetical protein